jgi:signal transduction histidine kinase
MTFKTRILGRSLLAGMSIAASLAAPAQTTDPAVVGQWSAIQSWPIVAVHAQMLAYYKKVNDTNKVELASRSLEEKAEQLQLISKYKSEFLANMSHELRTPLNSLLILARLLTENKEGNLQPRQVEYAQTILSAGTDLLTLITDVHDLSKVEAGKMELNPSELTMAEVREFAEQTFRPVAEQKQLGFTVDIQPGTPASLVTDGQRLHQVLKNLLSNAFKFTHTGGVTLTIRPAEKGRRFANPRLDSADMVIAFVVSDTGIRLLGSVPTSIQPQYRRRLS